MLTSGFDQISAFMEPMFWISFYVTMIGFSVVGLATALWLSASAMGWPKTIIFLAILLVGGLRLHALMYG